MKRRIALLIAVGLMGGCDLNAVVPAGPTQEALQTPSAPAADDGPTKPGTGPIKYPERPPCKVCINDKTWNNPHDGSMP